MLEIGRVISIIRINNKKLHLIDEDLVKLRDLGYEVTYHIPTALINVPGGKTKVHNLLLNYGFLEVPINYARTVSTLTDIRQYSEVINSFFFRKDLVNNIMEGENPLFIETVDTHKLQEILAAAVTVSNTYNGKEIIAGDYLTLLDKPFDGLMAQVLSITTKHIKVKLMIGSNFVLDLPTSFVNYEKVYNVDNMSSHAKSQIRDVTNY